METTKLIRIRAVSYAPMRVRNFSAREYLLVSIIIYIITAGPVRIDEISRRRRRNETMAKRISIAFVPVRRRIRVAHPYRIHSLANRIFAIFSIPSAGFWDITVFDFDITPALRRFIEQSSKANFL